MNEQLASSVDSGRGPHPKQKHRSSVNFTIDPPGKYTTLRWSCPPRISFSVMEDIKKSKDLLIFVNLTDGAITKIPRGLYNQTSFYISDPGGAKNGFSVKSYAQI